MKMKTLTPNLTPKTGALASIALAVMLSHNVAQAREGDGTGTHLVHGCSALQRSIERETYLQFGLRGSPARTAAQIQAESGCRPGARNRSGSRGLAQFMPGTARWVNRAYAGQLGGMTPYSVAWSIRAMVIYNRYHYNQIHVPGECDHWAFTLAAYNAGEGGMESARRRGGSYWFGGAERRAPSETRHYVHAILRILEPAYIHDGWRGEAVCI